MVFQVLRGKFWENCLSKQRRASRVFFFTFWVDFGSILGAEIHEKPGQSAPRKAVEFYLRFFGNFGRSWGAFSSPLPAVFERVPRAARSEVGDRCEVLSSFSRKGSIWHGRGRKKRVFEKACLAGPPRRM